MTNNSDFLHIAMNLTTGVITGCVIFFSMSAAWYQDKLQREKARASMDWDNEGSELITSTAEKKLRDHIDLNWSKMYWGLFCITLGLSIGTMIVLMGISRAHPSPASSQVLMTTAAAAFFTGILGIFSTLYYLLAALKSQKSMLMLQRTVSPAAKVWLPSGKELSESALMELCRKILKMYTTV